MPTLSDTRVQIHFASAALLTIIAVAWPFAALAQDAARPQTVTWSVAAASEAAKPGSKLALVVQGTVLDGWHVYSLKQAPDGPTPLLVNLAANAVAGADGAVKESTPEKIHDAAFGLDTQFFAHPFTVTVPVKLKANLKPGPQAIPLNVRFQTCSGGTCQPPKTVRLSAAIDVQAR
jgi:DsbC/DsbD-like thiol-disulfide interchange protein